MVDPLPNHPEVRAVLERLASDVQAVLGKCLVGLYVHGSLAYGDFDPETSDIDFLVVTNGRLPTETFLALQEMHDRLFVSGLAWSQKLEGAYLPEDFLRCHDPAHTPIPWLGVDGHFALENLGPDWVLQRWILREKGLVVAGPTLKPMIDPVSADDLREAVRGNLVEWWSPPFPSPERFLSDGYRAYTVLTMCRSLFVLEQGRPVSKPEAARWAMGSLGEPWAALIAAAAAWRSGMEFDRWEATQALIQLTLSRYDSF